MSPLEIGLVKQAISKQAHILSHRSLEPTNYGQSCREVWNFCLRMLCVSVGEMRCCFQVTESLIGWTFIRGFHSICLGRGFIKQAFSKHARIVHTYINACNVTQMCLDFSNRGHSLVLSLHSRNLALAIWRRDHSNLTKQNNTF